VSDAELPRCKLPVTPTLRDLVTLPNDCVVEEGTAFIVREKIVDSHGHVLDGDHDPLGNGGCQHEERKMKKHKTPEVEPTPEPLPVQPAPMTATMPPVVGATTASVGVADNAISEVKSLMPADGNANMITVALAVVGVAGGGAAIKLYQNMVKSKHDEAMKRLEIEEQRTQKQDDQHQACNAARAALEARVATLGAKVEELATKPSSSGSSFDLEGFDPEELEQRLKKLEESLKAKGKRR
jgi:hypothetical protein